MPQELEYELDLVDGRTLLFDATCLDAWREVRAADHAARVPQGETARAAKCVYCSYPVRRGDDVLVAHSDIFHAACFKILVADDKIRASIKLNQESRRLIDAARRQIREQRRRR